MKSPIICEHYTLREKAWWTDHFDRNGKRYARSGVVLSRSGYADVQVGGSDERQVITLSIVMHGRQLSFRQVRTGADRIKSDLSLTRLALRWIREQVK